jgi:hypothetical protein
MLDTPLVKAAKAVMDAEPRFFRSRLIELVAMAAQGVYREHSLAIRPPSVSRVPRIRET